MTGDRTDSMELIRRAQESDQAALSELLERYGDKLLGRIRLMMGDRARRVADSMDFLNGMFVQVIQGLDRFEIRDEKAFLRWATQIARNNIRDGVRKKRETAFLSFSRSSPGEPPGEIDQPSPGTELIIREENHRLLEALEQLPVEHCTIIELRDFEGLSYREIAERMNKPSEAAVQMMHARAVARLMKLMSDG